MLGTESIQDRKIDYHQKIQGRVNSQRLQCSLLNLALIGFGSRALSWLTRPIVGLRVNALVVPPTRLSTVGDRAFPVAAARVWNSLPVSITSAATLNTFKQRLKTELFIRFLRATA